MQYILKKLAEPSSWSGLGAILAVVGLNLEADLLQAIAVFGAAAAGLVGIVLDEKSA
jgi:hypothetical protein